jgi:hypothetical protein
LAALGLLVGCGHPSGGRTTGLVGATPPRVSAPATLAADGSVPWVDEPAAGAEFFPPAPTRRPVTTDRPCQAGDLHAVLPSWQTKGDGAYPGATAEEQRAARRNGPLGLIGTVTATNRSTRPCVLSGRLGGARLLVDGTLTPVEVNTAVDDAGRSRKTQVNPGEQAVLRLDWSPPYCRPPGRQTVELDLPRGGGWLTAPVTSPSQPPCSRSDIHSERRTFLSVSAWNEPPRSTVWEYPLAALTVSRVSPDRMTTPAGGTVEYSVRLTNPTGAPLTLTGTVYGQELLAMGSADREAVGQSASFRLNTRPVPVLAPGASQIFRFRLVLPRAIGPGRDASVSWRLGGPAVPAMDRFRTAFTITIR